MEKSASVRVTLSITELQVIIMGFKLLLLALLIKIVAAIRLEVNIDSNQKVEVSHDGNETSIVTDEDIHSFNIGDDNLKKAVEQYSGQRPDNVFVRGPTPWGDLYTVYKWEPVKRVLSVKSANVTHIKTGPVILKTEDTENPSKYTIKIDTSLSHTVDNTLEASWSNDNELGVSQDIEYEISVGYHHGGKPGCSFTTTFGKREKQTRNETIGTASKVGVELQPGEAVTTILTATAVYLEIEVVHSASLIGMVALNHNKSSTSENFDKVPIQTINNFGGIKKEITKTQTIRINFYVEAKLKVEIRSTI